MEFVFTQGGVCIMVRFDGCVWSSCSPRRVFWGGLMDMYGVRVCMLNCSQIRANLWLLTAYD